MNRKAYITILIMFAIYAISAFQYLFKEVPYIATLGGKSYGDRLDWLDKQYYRKEFYKYYIWLNDLLPNDMSFSIYYNDKTNLGDYQRWVHKLDYYFYPRYVLHHGIEKEVAGTLGYTHIKNLIFSEVVYIMDTKDVNFSKSGNLKYLTLKGKQYYLAAVKDNKGLLIERSYMIQEVKKKDAWKSLKNAFFDLYGIKMEKAVL